MYKKFMQTNQKKKNVLKKLGNNLAIIKHYLVMPHSCCLSNYFFLAMTKTMQGLITLRERK